MAKHKNNDHLRDRGIERVLQKKEDRKDVAGHSGKMKWTSKGDWSKNMNPRPEGGY